MHHLPNQLHWRLVLSFCRLPGPGNELQSGEQELKAAQQYYEELKSGCPLFFFFFGEDGPNT